MNAPTLAFIASKSLGLLATLYAAAGIGTTLADAQRAGDTIMNVNQMLQQTGAAEAISRELGVDPATAKAGASALLPSILSGFKNPVTSGDAEPAGTAFPGLGGLLGTLAAGAAVEVVERPKKTA